MAIFNIGPMEMVVLGLAGLCCIAIPTIAVVLFVVLSKNNKQKEEYKDRLPD